MSAFRVSPAEVIRFAAPLTILLGGVAGFAMLSNRGQMPVRQLPEAAPPLVETTVVTANGPRLTLDVDGLVVPAREIQLAAEVAGRVAQKAEVCRAGNFVTKGTLLVAIDARDYELDVRRLTNELAQADASLREWEVELSNLEDMIVLAQEELDLHRRELGRLVQLSARSVVTESEVDKVRQAELAARNNLTALKNQAQLLRTRGQRVRQARELVTAQLERAELDLARTRIYAPLDGVIVRDAVEQDSYLQRGALVAVVEDTSSVEVKCSLRMDELYWIRQQSARDAEVHPGAGGYQLPPTPATVIYRLAGDEFRWQGTLARYDGLGLDERTRTVPCRVVVPQPARPASGPASSGPAAPDGPALVRGMYVRVQVHALPDGALLQVPERAIRPGKVVWRVRDGLLQVVPVTIARIDRDTATIRPSAGDLLAGDRVVVSPLVSAADGMAVRETAPAPAAP